MSARRKPTAKKTLTPPIPADVKKKARGSSHVALPEPHHIASAPGHDPVPKEVRAHAEATTGDARFETWPDVSPATRKLVEARETIRKSLGEPEPIDGSLICVKTGRVETMGTGQRRRAPQKS